MKRRLGSSANVSGKRWCRFSSIAAVVAGAVIIDLVSWMVQLTGNLRLFVALSE